MWWSFCPQFTDMIHECATHHMSQWLNQTWAKSQFNERLKQQFDFNCSLSITKYKIKTASLIKNYVWDNFPTNDKTMNFVSVYVVCVLLFCFVCFACSFNDKITSLYSFLQAIQWQVLSIIQIDVGPMNLLFSAPIAIFYDYICMQYVVLTYATMIEFRITIVLCLI